MARVTRLRALRLAIVSSLLLNGILVLALSVVWHDLRLSARECHRRLEPRTTEASSSALLFSRSAVVLQSVGTSLESIYAPLALSYSTLHSSSSQACHVACTADMACVFWSFDRRNRVCFLFAREGDLLAPRGLLRGVIKRWLSGTPSRPFTLFTSPWTDRPRAQRTLVVVNFNWRATLDDIVQWSFMYPRVPNDVDFVLVQPYRHAYTLANPWSDQGKMGYFSLVIAHENLPGYRDYQYINDDSSYFFSNVHYNDNITAQSWTNAGWDKKANIKVNLRDTRHHSWYWCVVSPP